MYLVNTKKNDFQHMEKNYSLKRRLHNWGEGVIVAVRGEAPTRTKFQHTVKDGCQISMVLGKIINTEKTPTNLKKRNTKNMTP